MVANFYTPVPELTFDLDYANSWAYFVLADHRRRGRHARWNAGGRGDPPVPFGRFDGERSPRLGGDAAGALFRSAPPHLGRQREIKFHPHPEFGLGYRINRRWRATFEILNLLDRHDHDIDYYYQSRNSPAPGRTVPLRDSFPPGRAPAVPRGTRDEILKTRCLCPPLNRK